MFQDTEVILRIPLLKGGTFDEVAAAVLDYYSDGRPKCKGRAEKRYAAWKKALAQGKCPLERIGIFENMDSLSHSTHDERPEDKYKVPKELRCEDDAIDFMAVIDWAAIRECPRTPGSDKLPELLEFFETMTGKGWDASDVALIVIYSEVGKLFHAEYRYDRVRAQEVAESLRTEGQEVSQVLQDLEPVLPLVRPKNYRSASYLKMAALGEHELVEELLRNLEPEKRPTRKYWAHLAKHCWPREELIRKTER